MSGWSDSKKSGSQGGIGDISVEHYLLMLQHHKWLVLLTFLVVSAGTAIYAHYLPDVYTSQTLILVDPQQVPERFVNTTISGDIGNRLNTLSQQILSATRLNTIIERLNLYAEQKKRLVHEEVINMMRADITVKAATNLAGRANLQAFTIAYSGQDPRLVAQVTNELASLFIEENLKARERMATGTSEFIQNQLEEARKKLEVQEAQLSDFKLKHLGEMPEQQQANLQILGQLQARLQGVNDTLNRAEQQRSYLQALLTSERNSTSPQNEQEGMIDEKVSPAQKPTGPSPEELQLAALLSRYGENHPDVQRLKRQIEEVRQVREREEQQVAQVPGTTKPEEKAPSPATASTNSPVLNQLKAIEGEISQRKEEQKHLTETLTSYQAKVESVPIREQQITSLVRDYSISKDYYQQLLEKNLSAETATQLEMRQKGERFTILDSAQIPEKPSWPNRPMIITVGSLAGLALGLAAALSTQLLGITITSSEQVAAAIGVPVLGTIPILRTRTDRRRRRRAIVAGAASGVVMLFLLGALLFFRFRSQIF